jgi:hypothetical protein
MKLPVKNCRVLTQNVYSYLVPSDLNFAQAGDYVMDMVRPSFIRRINIEVAVYLAYVTEIIFGEIYHSPIGIKRG